MYFDLPFETRVQDSRIVILLDPNSKLLAGQGVLLDDPSQHRRLLYILIYPAIILPDIIFPFTVVGQFMHFPVHGASLEIHMPR